jgi:N-acetylmuramoyl-L-alanine amidase
VLTISEELATLLLDYGVAIRLTRSTDVFISLGERCGIANSWQADYFVSIHLNSNGATAVGIETLYTSEAGKALAAPIQTALLAATGDVDRGLKERDDLYVLNATNMPSVLVEAGFISHPPTEEKLRTPEYLTLLARAIAEGITEYLDLAPLTPPSPPPSPPLG